MEFITEIRKCGKRVLCNLVLEKSTGWLSRQYGEGFRRFVGLCLLFIIYESITLLFLVLFRMPVQSLWVASLLTSLIGSLSFYVVSWCYQYSLEKIETASSITTIGANIEKRMVEWLRKIVNIWIQFFVSVLYVSLVFLTIYTIKGTISIPSLFGLVLASFGMGQGGYWAVMGPLLTKELSRGDVSEIGHYPLYPNKTPILVAFSKVMAVYGIWDTIMVTLCVVTILVSSPDSKIGTTLYLWIFVISGYGITLWNFLYPQINLAIVLHNAKQNTLLQIQLETNKLYEEIGKLGNTDFERLKHLMELHDAVEQSPNTMINLSGITSFIGSLITPTAVALFGVLDWKSLLQKLIEFIK